MTTYIDPKNVNTNRLSNGAFVEKQNTPSSPGPVAFIATTTYQPSEKHISYAPTSMMTNANGSVWPVVALNNRDFESPSGNNTAGPLYNHISVPIA